MRRTEDASSSFDLFLDTICNTFGGIVFLAILLAVMIQNRSVVKSVDTDGQHATAEQVRQVMAELEDTTMKHERIELELAAMPEAKALVDDSEFRQFRDQQDALQTELAQALKAESELGKTLAATLAKNATARTELEGIPKKLEQTEKLLAIAKADYQALVESKQQTLRLPKVRSSQGASVLVLVQGKTLYLAKTPSLFKSGFNLAQVTATSKADSSIEIAPVIGSGWDLASPAFQTEFGNIVRQASADGNSITIAIWADSFGEFAGLRDKMVSENVFYQLWLQSDGEPLTIFLGGGQSSVQ